MADLIRPLRGAFPGPTIEPDAGIRAQLAALGVVGVRYGGYAGVAGGESPAARAARYGLVSAWNLEEVSGDRADAYGANLLTDNNTVTQGVGKLGNAAQFVLVNNEFLSRADDPILSAGNVDYWMAGWVKPAALGAAMYLIAHSVGAGEWRLNIRAAGGLRFQLFTAVAQVVGVDTIAVVSAGAWSFFFAYHDAVNDQAGIALDGGAFVTGATTGEPTDNALPFTLGAQGDGTGALDGLLDAVAFGKPPGGFVAASPTEIRDYLYAVGVGRQWPWAS